MMRPKAALRARGTGWIVALTVTAAAPPVFAGAPPKSRTVKISCDSLPSGPANRNLGHQAGENEPLVVGTNSNAGDLSTTGGLVTVGVNGRAERIKTTTGDVLVGPSGTAASISTESGTIETCGNSRVSGEVATVTGSIKVGMNGAVGRIVVRAPEFLPPKPPVIRLGPNAEVGSIELGYPVRICQDITSTPGELSGVKPLPCR